MIARLVISKHFQPVDLPQKHPDVLYFIRGEKLGIAQARKIKEHFSTKPYELPGKSVVIEEADNLTEEAQNALLKILEELPKDAIIIMGATSDANLLPTLISRCQVEIRDTRYEIRNNQDIEKLINATTEERFTYIEKLKDKEEFLLCLISYFHQNVTSHKDFLEELLQAEQWQKQNVNIRAILEYLMLSMPSET